MPNPPSFPKTEISRAIAPEGVDAIQFDSPFSFKNTAVRDAAYTALTSSSPTLNYNVATLSEIPNAGAAFTAIATMGVIALGQVVLLGDDTLWRLIDALGDASVNGTRFVPDDYDVDDNDVAWVFVDIEINFVDLQGLQVNATDSIFITSESNITFDAEEIHLLATTLTFNGVSVLTATGDGSALTGLALSQMGLYANGSSGTLLMTDGDGSGLTGLALSQMGLYANGSSGTLLMTDGDGSALTGLALSQMGLSANGSSGTLLMTDGDGSALGGLQFGQIAGVCSVLRGGTGVANSHTITVGGTVIFSGAFGFTATLTGTTTVTFPTSGTLLSTGVQTLTAAQMQQHAKNVGLIDPKLFVIREDFAAGTGSSGNIGECGLTAYSQSGVLSIGVNQGSYPNLGQVKLITGIITGNGGSLSIDFGNDGGNCFPDIAQPGWEVCFILALAQTTDCVTRIGLINSPGYAYNVAPGRGLYVRYIAGTDTNWMFVSNVGGVETATSSGVAVSTAFAKFRIRMTTAGQALFSINGGTETAITTAISGSTAPRVMFYTSTTAAKTLYWDFLGVLATTSR